MNIEVEKYENIKNPAAFPFCVQVSHKIGCAAVT